MAEAQEQKEGKIAEIDFEKVVTPFKDLSETALPFDLISNPYTLKNIGKVLFHASSEMTGEVDVRMIPTSRVIWVEVKLDQNLKEDRVESWLERLGLRITLANNLKLLGLPEKIQAGDQTTFNFNQWGSIPQVQRFKIFKKDIPPNERPKPLIVKATEIHQVKFVFNDSAKGKFS